MLTYNSAFILPVSSNKAIIINIQNCHCFLEECFPDLEGPRVGSLMAVLAVIGGIDGRLRLGGQVVHEEYGEGTVTRITPKGRITVQFHEMRTCRVCLLSHLKTVWECSDTHRCIETGST